MAKFSIITVSYNMAGYIEGTIESVARQNYRDYQYVIIDGGSTDGTERIVSKYANYVDIYISEPDKGIYDAMNKGISRANGDYVIFMNVGDKFASDNTLYDVSNFIKKTNGLYYGDSIRASSLGETILYREKTNRYRLTRKNICHQAIFYPLVILKEKGFDLSFPILADWARNIELFSNTKFYHMPFPVCVFKLDGVSSNNNRMKDPAFMDSLPLLIKNNLGLMPYAFFMFKQLVRSLIFCGRES